MENKYELRQDMFLGFETPTGFGTPDKKELLVKCECATEVLSVTKWADEDVFYLEVYKYFSPSVSFFTRLKWAWKVIKGKGISTADIVIEKEQFNKMCETFYLKTDEKVTIISALKENNNNRQRTAKQLGISERNLYRKIKKYNL